MSGHNPLQRNYADVLARIAAGCRQHDRPLDAVRLLAVSKTFGPDAVLALADCGQRAFGENYLQEALDKISACGHQRPELRLEWHFIGPIQSNKTRPVAQHFDWVHSVDRERIAQRLSDQRPPTLEPLQVCVQVNISGEASKSGCPPQDAIALARQVHALPRLRLRGLMALPEPSDDPLHQRAQYAAVRSLFEQLRAAVPDVDTLSMGMSADLDAAIAEGATIVRVGTALFGTRDRPARAC